MQIADYLLVFLGNIETTYQDVETVTAQLHLWRNGQFQRDIYPGRNFYPNFANQPASLISITTFGLTDVYVFLADFNGASEATIRVFVNTLVPLVWVGGLLMLLGGAICWWPGQRRRRVAPIVPARVARSPEEIAV